MPAGRHDRNTVNGDSGDLLNGVGSTSSNSTTASSIFSNGTLHGKPPQSKSDQSGVPTPSTNLNQSPFSRSKSPNPHLSSRLAAETDHDEIARSKVSSSSALASDQLSTFSTMLPERISAIPSSGEAKGSRLIFDPELQPKMSREERKKAKPYYKTFGEQDLRAPPDPRLALPGYRDGNLECHLKQGVKHWKLKKRDAPVILPQYAWDATLSIGAGPPTSIMVTGFDPFTPESQIRALFGSYGDIAGIENKTDPATGSFLGVCFIRYRDHRSSRGNNISAIDAARRAEKEGTGQRIGTSTVKAVRDRTGKRTARYVAELAKRNRERLLKEDTSLERRSSHATPDVPQIASAPPPNAPKGPSGRPSMRPPPMRPEIPPPRPLQKAPDHSLLEEEPILPKIGTTPFCFISDSSVPAMGTTLAHLEKRMKMLNFRSIRVDHTGYFIVFEDSRQGEDECERCKKMMDGQPMFTYFMQIECFPYGNPRLAKSPSPEPALALKREKREQERIQKEEEADLEEEKRNRAMNLDPVKAALEQLRLELRDKIISDIKQRIAAPALYNYMDPDKHVDKRRKYNIADPQKPGQTPHLSLGVENVFARRSEQRNAPGSMFKKNIGPSSMSISRVQQRDRLRAPVQNAFQDERRQRSAKRKPAHRLLLHELMAGDESDDERPQSSREQTKEQESRPVSRVGSIAPERSEDGTPTKKRQFAGEAETQQAEDSGDEDLGIAKTHLDPHLLKKEPEDMALRELQLIIDTAPASSRLHKQAKKELSIRKRKRDDDRLFHIKAEGAEEQKLDQDAEMLDVQPTTELAVVVKEKKKGKATTKRKTKKQLFEEREKAKADAVSAKSMLQEVEDLPTPEPTVSEVEKVDGESEEPRQEIEWAASRDMKRRTVEDDPNLVLDVDGWQHLVKDDEDFNFLQQALANVKAANIADANRWAHDQKEIKALNSGGATGVVYDASLIKGYYVSNSTGSARTEGVKKIVESEKSKYLLHRLRVAEERERRRLHGTTAANTAAADAAKQAKIASSALSRSARASNRTQQKDINTAKQSLIADGQHADAIRFNQLKKRKKLVKFDRSAIHGWGLYAEEGIPAGDMIIEYVGERVRQAVANIREMRYDKQGMGSSYLFRIDEDSIVDATKKGGIARFINHSCSPNCTAKIIRVEGTKRIVIYALKDVAKSEELTYDYKFEREMNSDDRIPCLCGSVSCKGFLN